MLQIAAGENMLVDYMTREVQGNFDFHIPEGQCAYLQLSDGREGFYESGDHRIQADHSLSLFRRSDRVRLYWFNLSDHIELHLSDTVQVMEQMLKTVDPELRLYAPVDVRVQMELTIRIENREKLLRLLMEQQEEDYEPVLEKEWLTEYLEEKLHYLLEESVNTCRKQSGIGIFQLSRLSEDVECALVGAICDLLESMSLEMMAVRISKIAPTGDGLYRFQEKEAETLAWYNQVQMDRFSRRKSRQVNMLKVV